jgi:hypothetical protein
VRSLSRNIVTPHTSRLRLVTRTVQRHKGENRPHNVRILHGEGIRFASMPHVGQRTTVTNIGAIGPVERSDYQMRHQALPYAPHDQTRIEVASSHRRTRTRRQYTVISTNALAARLADLGGHFESAEWVGPSPRMNVDSSSHRHVFSAKLKLHTVGHINGVHGSDWGHPLHAANFITSPLCSCSIVTCKHKKCSGTAR